MSDGVNKKPGNRQPSPRLHRITQKWTEDQWRQFVAFAKVYGNGSAQLRLLELVRSMTDGYKPALEREQFKDHHLVSLRYHAIRYSYNTGRRLDFIHDYDLVKMHGNIQLAIQQCSWEDATEFLAEAMEMAMAREDFAMTRLFLAQEMEIVMATLVGDARTQAMQQNAKLAEENAMKLLQEAAIAKNWATYLEGARNTFATTGYVDVAATTAYFASEIAQTPLQDFPLSLQLTRLKADEFAHYLLGAYQKAASLAEAQLLIYEENPAIRQRFAVKHSKAFMNLASHYSDCGLIEEALSVVHRFERIDPTSETNREHYLADYLFVVFQIAVDSKTFTLGIKGLQLWAEHREHILTLPKTKARGILFLIICTYHVLAADFLNARRDLNVLHTIKDVLSQPQFKAMYLILHLILLFEEKDEIGLASYGRNYKRQLEKLDPIFKPALEVVTVLQRQKDLQLANKKRADLITLISKVEAFSIDPEYKEALIYPELLLWLKSKRGN